MKLGERASRPLMGFSLAVLKQVLAGRFSSRFSIAKGRHQRAGRPLPQNMFHGAQYSYTCVSSIIDSN